MKLMFGGGVAAGALALVAMLYAFPQHAQEQETEEPAEAAGVTETELELYIDVYGTMQADHDLTIDSVLSSKGMPLDRFRNIEQRVQKEQRLVDRVRQALMDQAKHRSASAALTKENQPDPADAKTDKETTDKKSEGRH